MTDLWETGLVEGLPPAVADEPWIRIMDKVYRERHRREMEAADRIRIYTQIDSQPEEILDVLARQFKVDWYRNDYPIDTKRRIIRTAIEVRRFCGTEWATQQTIQSLYPDAKIKEWYKYGGRPGYWRLYVDFTNSELTIQSPKEIERFLGYARRYTAHLEYITYSAILKKCSCYTAAAHCKTRMKLTVPIVGTITPRPIRSTSFAAGASTSTLTRMTVKIGGIPK